ncbi:MULTISPECIES: hypothetical protein [unclassified Methanoregula]|uniref:hypothetical protein n=1 Tax=unclassified Methanoregula TaxID=2649730 RepID=UPI0009D1689C|nr:MULTISPECIES: hypothetical protein [unclassified Methanoregula]OPX62829.1 MAG: hypothetical protein A4E33_01958 [Methanoregula sp. PtaB.Bin085]OPY35266.1 MAG: hypothetical protein A4E34_00794 [Methanoregula sp. PtaU1.Bin006]
MMKNIPSLIPACFLFILLATGPAAGSIHTPEPGIVTVAAVNGQDYHCGDTIPFSGINNGSHVTYLFITGPNLPENGSRIQDPDPANRPVIDGDASAFQAVGVADDKRWTWTWDTRRSALGPGTYTIYAVSSPHDRNHLEYSPYGTTSIIMTKPGSRSSARPADSSDASFSLSAFSADPAGDLAAAMPVMVSFTIDFPATGDETFPSTHDLRIATDLENPRWNSTLVLEGVRTLQPENNGRTMFITGWLLSYPSSVPESLDITLTGTIPHGSSGTNQELLNISENDEQGYTVGSPSVRAVHVSPTAGKTSPAAASVNGSAGTPGHGAGIFGSRDSGKPWSIVISRMNSVFRPASSARV